MAKRMTGRCLCGGVTVRLAASTDEVGVCHCRMCRRWGGGPWMAVQSPGSEITGESLVIHRSSSFAERGFCGRCGTHIFHRPSQGPELAVSAGLFDNPDFWIAREIFDDARPPFYRFEAASVKRSGLSMTIEWLPKLIGRRLGLD